MTSIKEALLKPINTTSILILGVYTFVWGCWIANPFWEVFSTAALFSDMLKTMPEVYWGIIAIASGAIVCFGAMRGSANAMATGSTVAFLHWLVIGVLYLMGDWQNTGGITSLTFAAYAAYIHINVKVNNLVSPKVRVIYLSKRKPS